MPALSYSTAQRIVTGAMARARDLQINVSVAVVDAGGHILCLGRMEEAGWATPDVATAKARTATAFKRDTEEMEQRFENRPLAANGITTVGEGRLIFLKGGVVVRRDGTLVGAVGVSGGTGEQDVECARAGVSGAEL